MRDSLLNPARAVNLSRLQVAPPAARCHTVEGQLLPLARGLLARGLVRTALPDKVPRCGGRPFLNGWFGVPKAEALADASRGRCQV